MREQIAALTTDAATTDAVEDAVHGPEVRGDELPAELQRREKHLATIAAATARLEARQADADRQKGRTPDDGRKSRGTRPFARDFGGPPDGAQDNFTDPESRIMKTSTGYDQCDNGPIAVDEASQLMVATGVTHCAADHAAWLPLTDQAHATRGAPPREVLADAGSRAEATFHTLETRAITAYLSLGREGKPDTTPNPAQEATHRMAARLASEGGRARYRRRTAIVEPVLDRLATDGVDHIIDSLRFLGAHQRTVAKRTAVADLQRSLTTNRERMRYHTFRAAGYVIGSGAVESAVSHVVPQRMKRVGMRWRSAGADAMLALRSIDRSTGAWNRFWTTRRVA